MPRPATETLLRSFPQGAREVTVADAAAASGLSLAEAERALHALSAEYRGHLRVTDEGQLLFRFPTGFTKPWETQEALARIASRVAGAAAAAGRFVVRAWVAIVLVAYALVFLALVVAMALRGSEDRGDDRGGLVAYAIFRLVAEALFWTFHPFSPFAVREHALPVRRRGRRGDGAPFYERVDRFFFGPRPAPRDPEAPRRAVLAAIREGKGRIGIGDVMRVTGLPRDAVDPLVSRLLVDHDGTVEVSEEGGIAFRFPELRKTAAAAAVPRARPVWEAPVEVPPVTGNRPAHDVLIGALNGFNLVASAWALSIGLTVERAIALGRQLPPELVPPPGLPIALGIVPLVFSILLFLLPLGRLVGRRRAARRAARENGRRAVLRAALETAGDGGGVTEDELVRRWRIATGGTEPTERELLDEVRALGGDVDLERADEGVRYRFVDLELEARAVEAEREAASESEARVGRVVFATDE